MEFGIVKCAMFIMKEETNNRRNGIAKSEKNPNAWRKGKLQVLWNIGTGHERKCEKRVLQTNEKAPRNQALQVKFH